MKYILRSVKYFVYLAVLFFLLIGAMVLLGFVEASWDTMFRNGTESLKQIAVIGAVFALIYPRFGYSKNEIISGVELKPLILSVMDSRGYKLRSEEGDTMVFIKRSPLDRALRMWEDAITFTRNEAGYDIEGHTKEMVRCRSAILNVSSEE